MISTSFLYCAAWKWYSTGWLGHECSSSSFVLSKSVTSCMYWPNISNNNNKWQQHWQLRLRHLCIGCGVLCPTIKLVKQCSSKGWSMNSGPGDEVFAASGKKKASSQRPWVPSRVLGGHLTWAAQTQTPWAELQAPQRQHRSTPRKSEGPTPAVWPLPLVLCWSCKTSQAIGGVKPRSPFRQWNHAPRACSCLNQQLINWLVSSSHFTFPVCSLK